MNMGNYFTKSEIEKEYMRLQFKLQNIEQDIKKLEQKYKSMIYYLEKQKILDNNTKELNKKVDKMREEMERLYDFVENKLK